MNKILIVLLAISIIGNAIGLYYAYRYIKVSRRVEGLNETIVSAGRMVGALTDRLETNYNKRMIFLHHSVGKNILDQGGLRDSLMSMGIFVKGATYGDEIGNRTDICDWTPKFTTDFKRILTFKNHPNQYYTDGRENDIVMFKSCFPNAYVESEGSGSGDPTSPQRTIANYKAAFAELTKEFRKYPNKLFIYLTYPPLAPSETTPEAAMRAREFNAWLQDEYLPQYQKETGLKNFYVFDLFDVFADESNALRKEYLREDVRDSHPNELGSKDAAQKFMTFFRPIWSEWESTRAQQPAASSVSSL